MEVILSSPVHLRKEIACFKFLYLGKRQGAPPNPNTHTEGRYSILRHSHLSDWLVAVAIPSPGKSFCEVHPRTAAQLCSVLESTEQ